VTLEEFVTEVRSGNVSVETGGMIDGDMATWIETLGTNDAEAVAVEAFARGVIPADMALDDAVARIEALLAAA
jgi:uncharacterized membrane protein